MTVWWLRGYINGEHDLWYPAFVTYGEARAKEEEQKIKYPYHSFTLTKGTI